ncbi:hypothetical protein EBR96_04095, partial [bacterium]|nr:hypothetical protein [bacterium]
QGSGKTTAARVVQAALENLGLTVVTFSMDDLYLTYDQRQDRASKVHPLFATRSVPGTHDIELGIQILDQLERGQPVTIPAFDKSAKGGEGDRIAKELWDQNVDTRADVVIVEGWCLGAPPIPKRELDDPINAREAEEDPDKIWRTEINTQLKGDYHRFFEKMDDIVFFQVPDIETVYENRNKQEQQLGEAIARRRESGYSTDSMGTMSEEKIRRFIQLFERLTLHMMKRLPGQVTMTVQFDRGHKFRELVPKTPSTS